MDNQPINLFSGAISTLSRSLDLRARNHEVVLNNIANADTPNFKPFAVKVEEALQEQSRAPSAQPLMRTDEQHLPGRPPSERAPVVAGSTADGNPLLFRGDRNGVDIDAEMTTLAKNSLLYKASAQMVASKFKGLKHVISGGSR
ncbi:MAG: flagellar basal body rod protein FlgB [Desulfosarcina sp.]